MSIRQLVVAALLASAGAAQAEVVTTTGFQNGWTSGNGTSVLGSGVLGNDVSLVGGVAHSVNGDLSSALIGKASASLSSADSQKLFVQQGIDASYVLSSGNGLLAARYGKSVSVINNADGVIIVPGATVGVGAGAGAAVGVGAGAGAGGGAGAGAGTGIGAGAGTGTGSGAGSDSGAGAGGGTLGGGATVGGNTGGGDTTTPGVDSGIGGGSGDPILALPVQDQVGLLPAEINAVPEPGSIALMLAGLMGAGVFARRRKGNK